MQQQWVRCGAPGASCAALVVRACRTPVSSSKRRRSSVMSASSPSLQNTVMAARDPSQG